MKPYTDPNFPGLSTALDLSAVLESLRHALPECKKDVELLGGTIVDVRYRPHGACWILYRLKLRAAGRRSTSQLLSARVLRANEKPASVPEHLVARYRDWEDKILQTPSAYLSRLHMATYAFPIDASQPWLFDAMDPKALRRHLHRLWADRKLRVRDVKVRVLGFTPHARAAFLYEVLAESKPTGIPEIRRLIGKLNAKKKAQRLFAGSWALWRAAGKRIRLAPPVGCIPALNLTLQEQVYGERLGGLTTVGAFVKRVRQTARTIATLHELSIPLFTRRRGETEARVAERWSGVLAAIQPELRTRVERLRDKIVAELVSRTSPSAPVHADFHHTNVLVQDQGVAIIDLDEMAYGDPMLDVGRFLASLRIPALRIFGDMSGLAPARDAFLSAYLAKNPGDERQARLFEAASLFTAAASAFRIQRPTWGEEIPLLLEEAERALQRAGVTSVPAVEKSRKPAPLPVVKNRKFWTQDEVYMRAVLEPYVRDVYGAELTKCRVAAVSTTEKGDRIRYHLRGWRDDERWSVPLQGLTQKGHGRKQFLRRLEALRDAVKGRAQVPCFPRPLTYLRPLSLLVWEVPSGTRFSDLVGTGDGVDGAARIGRALAALHATTIDLESRRPLDGELGRIWKRIERLENVRPELYARARPLFEQVEARAREIPYTFAPVLCTLHPHHILLGERVGFAWVQEVTVSHPLIDVADFLARLALHGINRSDVQRADLAATSFREAYGLAASGLDASSVFEAGALIRLACARAHAEVPLNGTVLDQLLDRAAGKLAGDHGGGSRR